MLEQQGDPETSTVQSIVRTILLSKNSNLLESTFTRKEKILVDHLKEFRAAYKGRNLRIKDTFDGNSVLIWESYYGRTIACPITKYGFDWRNIQFFKEREKEMDGKIKLDNKPYRVDNKDDNNEDLIGEEYNQNLLKKEILDIQFLFEPYLVETELAAK